MMKKFDVLVAQAWRGRPEGTSFVTLEGCTFRVYSTAQAAYDAGERAFGE